MLKPSIGTLAGDRLWPMPMKPGRLGYVEAAMHRWIERGVEALIEFIGPEVEWHPHDSDRSMRGPEVLDRVQALEAGGVTRRARDPKFKELPDCVLVNVAARDYHTHGFLESRRTLRFEFAGDTLVRVRSLG